ncbi:MAG: tRNA pseudouridine(55) synthase, partial [Flavobacteriaceae bacterium]|nr:tRNA pseudouridine(55) synthase [Flavobacteriaceae bacterium]
IMQFPPMYSAVKKDGKRLYKMAREGFKVEVKARSVNVLEFEILNINELEIEFKVVCSKGTYIRSLAHDFGKALDSGAHLIALRRTGIGDFNVNNALSIDAFIEELNGI